MRNMPTGVLAAPALSRETAASPYRWLALAAAAVALGGFARSYYLKGFFGTRSLGVTLQVHALVMSAWLGVFIVQTWLVAAHRVRWHRRLGVAAAALAVLVVGMGAWLTVQGVAGEAHAHRVGRFHYLLLINLVNLMLFGVFVGCGLALRARPEVHKRLMLLAAVTLLAPAVARIVLLFAHGPAPQFLAFYTCIAGCVLVETLWYRRLHPVLGWGALTIVAAFQLSYLAVKTPAWMALVERTFGGQ